MGREAAQLETLGLRRPLLTAGEMQKAGGWCPPKAAQSLPYYRCRWINSQRTSWSLAVPNTCTLPWSGRDEGLPSCSWQAARLCAASAVPGVQQWWLLTHGVEGNSGTATILRHRKALCKEEPVPQCQDILEFIIDSWGTVILPLCRRYADAAFLGALFISHYRDISKCISCRTKSP